MFFTAAITIYAVIFCGLVPAAIAAGMFLKLLE